MSHIPGAIVLPTRITHQTSQDMFCGRGYVFPGSPGLGSLAGVPVENIPPTKLYPQYVLAYNHMPNYIPFTGDWCVEM